MKALFWIGPCGFGGSIIRAFKKRGISHSEIMFSDGFCGTSYPGEGIVFRKLEIKPLDWFIVDIEATPEVEALVRRFFADEAGCKYDWFGLLSAQVFGWAWQSKERWFCSEACTAALIPAVPSLIRVRPCSVDPAKLAILLEESPEGRVGNASPIG